MKNIGMFLLCGRLFTRELFVTGRRFAGHSKWANIRHIKALKDGERSQVFARLAQQLRIAAQEGGSADPSKNLRLSQLVEQAKKASMPAISIQNVLKQCQDSKPIGSTYVIGLKGPGGLAVLVAVVTNNYKGSRQHIASIIKKTKFTFSEGNWNHLFTHRGIIEADIQENSSSDDVLGHALEIGAEDVVPINNNGEEYVQFVCDPNHLYGAKKKLENLGYVIRLAESEYTPSMEIVPSESDIESIQFLYKRLESMPDISGIYDNISWNS